MDLEGALVVGIDFGTLSGRALHRLRYLGRDALTVGERS